MFQDFLDNDKSIVKNKKGEHIALLTHWTPNQLLIARLVVITRLLISLLIINLLVINYSAINRLVAVQSFYQVI